MDKIDGRIVVRSKSSNRKSRSENIEHAARQPSQQRSLDRFERIVKATEELLKAYNIEDLSFYDIARQAAISPASINYLFPTMAALRIELSKRYASIGTEVTMHAHHTQLKSRNPSWQRWMYEMGVHTRADFNRNRHMCEVMLGPELHREARRAVILETDRAARELLQSLQDFFVLPDIPGLEEKLALALHTAEAIWSRSYILHGFVDDEAFEESMRMQIAYLRMFLPETLAIKDGNETDGAAASETGAS